MIKKIASWKIISYDSKKFQDVMYKIVYFFEKSIYYKKKDR